MSGHSKWSTIRHKKALVDSKRGEAFTRVANKIYLSVRGGGSGDPEMNPTLRTLIEEARSINMPSEKIKTAIERAQGKTGTEEMFEAVYEGYVCGGVGVMVCMLTDNLNRTGSEVRLIFEKAGGSLGGPGSVAYMKNITPVMKMGVSDDDRQNVLEMFNILKEREEFVSLWTNLEGYE